MGKKKSAPRPDPAELRLPLSGVDSHAHLDMDEFAADLDAVLDQARGAGVARIGNVFLGPEAYAAGRALFDAHPQVFFLLGVHPNEADTFSAGAEAAMRRAFAEDTRLRAVGEIGLDFYWDRVPRKTQEEAFRAQLNMARDLGLPPVIHCRDAEDATLAVLAEEGYNGRKLLWHCYGGDERLARRLVDNGWHLSIPGPVTYPKNEALRRAAAAIPLDRLLIETDCPYLSPQPWRGKRNHPALSAFTAQAVAQARGADPAELWAACGDNAKRFFGLEDL